MKRLEYLRTNTLDELLKHLRKTMTHLKKTLNTLKRQLSGWKIGQFISCLDR